MQYLASAERRDRLRPRLTQMPQEPATRFDDLLLAAVAAIQAMTRRGKPWEETPEGDRGRAFELDRGIAGERRYARQAENQKLLLAIDALKASASARLRMLEGLPTAYLAARDEDYKKRVEAEKARDEEAKLRKELKDKLDELAKAPK